MPAVQLTTHVKSSTLYSRTVVHPSFFGLMGYYYLIMGLRSASSAINTNLLHYLICFSIFRVAIIAVVSMLIGFVAIKSFVSGN